MIQKQELQIITANKKIIVCQKKHVFMLKMTGMIVAFLKLFQIIETNIHGKKFTAAQRNIS